MTKFSPRALASVVLTCTLAACADSIPTAAVSPDLAGFASAVGPSGSACASSPDFVVSDQAALSAALAAAGPGTTIAINGIIEVTGTVSILGDGIRLTCAGDGSGLITRTGTVSFVLVAVEGDDVQVDNLVLSSVPSSGPGGAPNVVYVSGPELPGGGLAPNQGFRLSNNLIRCRRGSCAFLVGTLAAVVADNTVHSLGTSTGIHVQETDMGGGVPTDNTIVQGNEITAPANSGSPLFGAIRVRGGRNLVVRHNSISGGWRNGITLSELDGALVQNNLVLDVRERGIFASTNAVLPASVRNSIIRANRIHGRQQIGVSLNRACWNRVDGNEIRISPGATRALFEATTGANVYSGVPANVVDQGSFDCDADGDTDPNTISGSPAASTVRASVARIEPASTGIPRSVGSSAGGKIPELQ